MDLKEKIRDFINTNLIVFDDDAVFTDSDNIFEKGFVNSLFAMKLLTFIETEYSIVVDEDEMEISNFSSVEKICALVQSKTEAVSA